MTAGGDPRPIDAEMMALVAQLDATPTSAALPQPVAAIQPIVHLEADVVVGYEALARFADGSPGEHFARAAQAGRSVELELACCAAALERIGDLGPGTFVSTNVSAGCLGAPELIGMLRDVDTSRVAVELTQQSPVDDVAILDHQLAALRGIGAKIAIDDVGVGDFRIERITNITPTMLKASRELVAGCDDDPERQARLAGVVALGRRVGAITIGVGVERPEEASVLRRLGFDAAQGYLFGRPELQPSAVLAAY